MSLTSGNLLWENMVSQSQCFSPKIIYLTEKDTSHRAPDVLTTSQFGLGQTERRKNHEQWSRLEWDV